VTNENQPPANPERFNLGLRLPVTALPGGDGLWHVGPVTLPRPGDWGVTLRLFVPDLGTVTLTETLTLPD
ncbi:MAG: hypothetical protein ACLGIE_17990, partial [Alphaproteobacteria bacterium]